MSRTRAGRALPAAAFVLLGVVGMGSGASAATGQVSAQYQGYSVPADQQNPFANDNPDDVHVQGSGGQPIVNGYIRLNLDSLPARSSISGLSLTLRPNSSQADNVNTSTAVLEACILVQPLTSNGYQSNPPPFDCKLESVAGEPQPNGDWKFELGSMGRYWEQRQNTGLALVAYTPPTENLPVSTSAWSIAFNHTATSATVDYRAATTTSTGPAAGPANADLGPAPVAAPGNALSVNPAPLVVAPVVPPLPAGNDQPGPAPAPPPAVAPAAAPPGVSATAPKVNNTWLWLSIAIATAAVVMVAVGASQHVFREGIVSPVAVGRALSLSRSQLATPVSILVLASVFALGSTSAAIGGFSPGGLTPGGTANGLAAAGGATPPPGGSPTATPSGSSGQAGSSGGAGGAGTAVTGGNAATKAGGQGSASTTDGGLDGPGVTSTTVRLGYVYTTNSNAANAAFGLQVAGSGQDMLAEEHALVDYFNAHGGVGGRQIQPFFVPEDVQQAETDPTIGEGICKHMTEDLHVFAVVSVQGTPNDSNTAACYASHGTMMFDVTPTVPDLAFLRSASPYIWSVDPAALDRNMRITISGLQQRGFFSGGANYKLGVVIASDPLNERVYSEVTTPALSRAGVTNQVVARVRHDTLSNGANDMKQTVARFQLAGVTNVIFQGGGSLGGGSYAVLFMLNAGSQSYQPRYGLSSQDAPQGLVESGQVQMSQFKDALAVGINPGSDTDDKHYKPYPDGADEQLCASIEKQAYAATTRAAAGVQGLLCNGMFELVQGANGPGALNAQIWANRAMQLGGSLHNTTLYQAYLGPNHWDAPGGYRLLHAVQNCVGSTTCWVYDDSNIYPAN